MGTVYTSKLCWVILAGCTTGSALLTYAITKQTVPIPEAKTYIGGAAIGSFVGGLAALAILYILES